MLHPLDAWFPPAALRRLVRVWASLPLPLHKEGLSRRQTEGLCLAGTSFRTGRGSKYSNGIELAMTEFDATVRKVGDSMGIIIPHRVVEQIKARPGQKIRIVIPGKIDWSKIWGRLEAKEASDQMIRAAVTERD